MYFTCKRSEKEVKKMRMNTIDWVAYVLVMVGALNWGLMSISSGWNVVEIILGSWPTLVRIVYGLVGLGALYSIYHMFTKM